MRIGSSVSATQGLELFGSGRSRREPGQAAAYPLGDTADISAAAREAYAAWRRPAGTDQKEDSGEGRQARLDFAEYMKEARGEVADPDEDPVERLKKMIEKLEKKLESAGKSDLPAETKGATMEALHEQISSLRKDFLQLTKGA